MARLGEYIAENNAEWQAIIEKAHTENGWFIPEFTQNAARSIADNFLQAKVLSDWTADYSIPDTGTALKTVGIVMAGNIPLAGFHDLMTVFISGNRSMIKLSSKDKVLIPAMVKKLAEWEPAAESWFEFSEMLKGCDAYIATGSNNSSRYFEYYFSRFPHIIRKNRSSAAILDGNESYEELEKLADDVFLYFGLGCRNVTKIYVPRNYDFLPLLAALKKYLVLADHNKYKNNYDYNLALHLLNRTMYMSNGAILLIESPNLLSPVSQLNYEFYESPEELRNRLGSDQNLQCIVSRTDTAFGMAQNPAINEYADGIDTLEFLSQLTKR
jgi:hypothetical protein